MVKLVVSVSTGTVDSVTTGVVVVPDSTGDDGVTEGEGVEDGKTTGEVVPDSIGDGEDGVTDGEGVEEGETTGVVVPLRKDGDDGVTDGEGVEDGETTGVVVPDSIGEGAEGVTEGDTWGAVESGGLTGLEGTTTGVLLCAGGVDAGGVEHVDDGAGTQLKFIPTTPMGTFGPDGELG